MAGLNQTITAIVVRMPWVYAGVVLVAAALVLRRYQQTRQRGLLLVASGLSLVLLGSLVSLVWGALYPAVVGPPQSLTPEAIAHSTLISSIVILFNQLVSIIGVVLIGIGTLRMAEQ